MRNVATKWNKWNKNKFQYFISINVYFITSKNSFFIIYFMYLLFFIVLFLFSF